MKSMQNEEGNMQNVKRTIGKWKISLIIFHFLFCIASSAMAADIALFRNDISAFPSALNGAASTDFGTPYSQFYNPAAPGYKAKAAISSTVFSIYDTDLKEIELLYPTQWGAFSSALVYGSMDGLLRTSLVSGRPAPSGGEFGYSALKFLFGWSDKVSHFSPALKDANRVSVGLQLEYLSESLDKSQGMAVLGNIGVLYAPWDSLVTALSYRNILAGQEQWSNGASAAEALDSYVRLGVKYIIVPDMLSINVDYPLVENGKLRAGVAYRLLPQLTLLLGTGDTSLSGGARLTFSGINFDVAYLSAKHDVLSDSYRFSVGYDLSGLLGTGSSEDEATLISRYYASSDTQARVSAINGLTRYDSSETREVFLNGAKSTDKEVRKAALKALVSVYPGDAVVLLVDCLFETDPEIKALAAFYLGNIGNAEVLSVLEQVLPFENNKQVADTIQDAISRLKSKL